MWQCPPIRLRIFVSKAQHGHHDGTVTHQPDRPGSYKKWTEESMEKALKAVLIHHSSIQRAALDYKVPKSTLGDRVHGRVQRLCLFFGLDQVDWTGLDY